MIGGIQIKNNSVEDKSSAKQAPRPSATKFRDEFKRAQGRELADVRAPQENERPVATKLSRGIPDAEQAVGKLPSEQGAQEAQSQDQEKSSPNDPMGDQSSALTAAVLPAQVPQPGDAPQMTEAGFAVTDGVTMNEPTLPNKAVESQWGRIAHDLSSHSIEEQAAAGNMKPEAPVEGTLLDASDMIQTATVLERARRQARAGEMESAMPQGAGKAEVLTLASQMPGIDQGITPDGKPASATSAMARQDMLTRSQAAPGQDQSAALHPALREAQLKGQDQAGAQADRWSQVPVLTTPQGQTGAAQTTTQPDNRTAVSSAGITASLVGSQPAQQAQTVEVNDPAGQGKPAFQAQQGDSLNSPLGSLQGAAGTHGGHEQSRFSDLMNGKNQGQGNPGTPGPEASMDASTAVQATQAGLATAGADAVAPKDATPVSDKNLVDRLVQDVRWSLANNQKEVLVRLNPENLGHMEVKVSQKKGKDISVELSVENNLSRQMVESRLIELRQRLEAEGYTNPEVTVRSDLNRQGGWEGSRQFSQNQGQTQGLGGMFQQPAMEQVVQPTRPTWGNSGVGLYA
ncbi:MAG: flagellar hook-length control protein FliK [Deltaproteobacteria bacterium]|nr:flagellar hook-length control protein FliK [Deltaproteobacteria bacterium]